jgi:hypothetical protein
VTGAHSGQPANIAFEPLTIVNMLGRVLVASPRGFRLTAEARERG